jgi:hypothetical protein
MRSCTLDALGFEHGVRAAEAGNMVGEGILLRF